MFELLVLIPRNDWDDAIFGLRKRIFPAYTKIKDTERHFIEVLLSENPEDRPRITQILDFAEEQIALEVECEGTLY